MVTNVRFQRLAALVLLLGHGIMVGMPARAGDWMPMLPSQDFYDFQLFAPPDLQDYEIYPEPSEGIFFNYDRLYWGITPPRVAGVAQTAAGNYLIPYQPISPQSIVTLNNEALAANTVSGTTGGADRRLVHVRFGSSATRPEYQLDAHPHGMGQSLRGRLDL